MKQAWKSAYYAFAEGFVMAIVAHIVAGLAAAGAGALARFGGHVLGTVTTRLFDH